VGRGRQPVAGVGRSWWRAGGWGWRWAGRSRLRGAGGEGRALGGRPGVGARAAGHRVRGTGGAGRVLRWPGVEGQGQRLALAGRRYWAVVSRCPQAAVARAAGRWRRLVVSSGCRGRRAWRSSLTLSSGRPVAGTGQSWPWAAGQSAGGAGVRGFGVPGGGLAVGVALSSGRPVAVPGSPGSGRPSSGAGVARL